MTTGVWPLAVALILLSAIGCYWLIWRVIRVGLPPRTDAADRE